MPTWWTLPALAALILAVYHGVAQRYRVAVLAVGSLGFYAVAAPRFAPLLLAVIAVAHFAGRRLAREPNRWVLAAAIAVLLGALAVLRALYRGNPLLEPFVAIGASFYVLQAISYLADVHNGVRASRASLSELTVYLAYFPKLFAGPIERTAAFCAQLRTPRSVDDDAIGRAGGLIVLGLLRKLVIADPLRAALPAALQAEGPAMAVALVLFAFAIYNDFAAYTDLARGVSLLFGIELSPNFRQPFFASGATDFWNRWHATLTHWLRDYVYLPVSRALLRRDARADRAVNLIAPPLATMLASALWHGGSAGIVAWGIAHGGLLAFERAFLLWHAAPRRRLVARRVLFWSIGLATLPLFVADIGGAAAYWGALVSQPGAAMPPLWPLLLVVLSLAIDAAQARGGELFFLVWPRPLRAFALAAVALMCFLFAHTYEIAPFVYQGF